MAALQQGEDSRRVRKILVAARYFSQKEKLIKVVCSLKFIILKKRVFLPIFSNDSSFRVEFSLNLEYTNKTINLLYITC